MDNQFDNEQQWTYEVPHQPAPQPQPQKNRTAGSIIAVALCCSLLGGAVGAGGAYLLTRQKPAQPEAPENITHVLTGLRENSVLELSQIDTNKTMTPAEVYAANVNSTVGITTSITTNFWGYQTTAAASGSGFILSSDGYILTNFHVIDDSDSISVRLYNGESLDATLIGYDKSNDIAVLKV